MSKSTWGGYRPGSGRRPKGDVSGVSHHSRRAITASHPVQVVMNTKPELGSLRKKQVHGAIRESLYQSLHRGPAQGSQRGPVTSHDASAFRICHYSVQTHSIRFIIEARDREALSRGMQGLNVRIAKALNRLWSRNGSVFSDRYDVKILETGEEVRDSLRFVLNGARTDARAARKLAGKLDPYSSASYFDGWYGQVSNGADRNGGLRPVAEPRTALLKRAWRKHGLLRPDEISSQRE